MLRQRQISENSTGSSMALTAVEPGDVQRRGFPLTVGVPFALGRLKPDQPVGLTDSQGRQIPLQTRLMEKHADGSVRWLLVDYQADFEPLKPSTYTLQIDQKPAEPDPEQGIRTQEQDGMLLIENGALKLQVDLRTCRPLLRLWRAGKLISDGPLEFIITSEDGREFSAGADSQAKFTIEESGPLRMLMRWQGTHKSKDGQGHFDFDVSLTVYAGQPFVRIDHVFINRLDAGQTGVKQILVRLPIQLAGDLGYSAAGGSYPYQMHPAQGPCRLEILELGDYRLVGEDGKVYRDNRPPGSFTHCSMGWLDVSGTDAGIMLAGKNFWQNYPKVIAAGHDRIECFLIPDQGLPFPVPRGMAKTHTFFISVHDIGEQAPPLTHLAAMVQRWPMPTAPARYYQDTDAFWDFFPYYPQEYPRLEVALRDLIEPDEPIKVTTPPLARAYGLKHYGDHVRAGSGQTKHSAQFLLGPEPDESDTYYLNNEYDTPHVLAMLFLRTREIMRFWTCEAHALHMMDVDTCHHAVEGPPNELLEDWQCLINCQYRHCYQHVGGIQSPDETRHVPAAGSHTFAEGLLDYYHLTGDRRALEVATNYALRLAYMIVDRGYDWGISRNTGWGMLVLGGVYMANPLPKISKAADILLDRIGKLKSTHDIRHDFLTLRGIIKWHQATADPRAEKIILDFTNAFLESCQSEEGLFLYSDWPELNRHIWPMVGYANLEALAYCYELTGDRKYIEQGLGTLTQAINWILHPTHDKGVVLWMRMLRGPFRFMAIAHDLGLMQGIPEAGHWIAKNPL